MQWASSITSRPELRTSSGSTVARKVGLASRSGLSSSRSTSPRSIRSKVASQSSRLEELTVAASIPSAAAASSWLRISAISGETRIVGPAPASRSSAVATK